MHRTLATDWSNRLLLAGLKLVLAPALCADLAGCATFSRERKFDLVELGNPSMFDSENGEVLLDLPDYQRFTWLDSDTGIVVKRNQAAADLIDFTSNGRAVAVEVSAGLKAPKTR